jgi:hypothetical protein
MLAISVVDEPNDMELWLEEEIVEKQQDWPIEEVEEGWEHEGEDEEHK